MLANREEMNTSVLLVDDFRSFRTEAASIIQKKPEFNIIAEASNGLEAIEKAELFGPDLILLDIGLPKLNGIGVAKELTHRKASSQIVFLTGEEDDDCVSEALTVGAKGYVFKRRLQSDLVPALKLAAAGHFFVSPYGFIGQTDSEVMRPSPASSSAWHGSSTHTMEFYSDESALVSGVSELVRASLSQDRVVVALLKRNHIACASRRLVESGVDLEGAIRWGGYRPFAIEGTIPFLMPNGRLDRARFATFFEPVLAHAAWNAERKCSGAVVLADLASALIDLGYDHENALRTEELWNDLVQKRPFLVHCVCPVTTLGAKRNRDTLAQICPHHSRVIPIHQLKRGLSFGQLGV